MVWQTTKGITVQVRTRYESAHSNPEYKKYVHRYHITIINDADETVQLLRRHWYIYDADTTVREVKGNGVIGLQPVIRPGQYHEYTSWTPLHTAIGKMKGYYVMIKPDTQEEFKVIVPEFKLVAPHKLN